MRVIMIAGRLCAGKNTVALMVRRATGDPSAPIISFSTLFEKILMMRGDEPTRENMKCVADTLKRRYGQRVFAEMLSELVAEQYMDRQCVIVCGARFPEDLRLLSEYDSTLVGVQADFDVRYARALRDPRKNGNGLSREAFARMDGDPREGSLGTILKEASAVFENNGTRDALFLQVRTRFTRPW